MFYERQILCCCFLLWKYVKNIHNNTTLYTKHILFYVAIDTYIQCERQVFFSNTYLSSPAYSIAYIGTPVCVCVLLLLRSVNFHTI